MAGWALGMAVALAQATRLLVFWKCPLGLVRCDPFSTLRASCLEESGRISGSGPIDIAAEVGLGPLGLAAR